MPIPYYAPPYVAAVVPADQQALVAPAYQQPRAHTPQHHNAAPNQKCNGRNKTQSNPITMPYNKLYPSLIQKGLVVPMPLPPILE